MGLAAWPREDRRAAPRATPGAVPNGITLVPIVFGSLSVLVLCLSLVHHTPRVASLMALGALGARHRPHGHDAARGALGASRSTSRVARVDELTGLQQPPGLLRGG